MKIFIRLLLALHILPLFVLGWATLFDLAEFTNLQWGVAWFMTFSSVLLSMPVMYATEKDNVKN